MGHRTRPRIRNTARGVLIHAVVEPRRHVDRPFFVALEGHYMREHRHERVPPRFTIPSDPESAMAKAARELAQIQSVHPR